jgi:transketolase
MTDTVELARAIRLDVVQMTSRGRSSHVGSGLSIADLLAVLYGSVLRVNPADPTWRDRDRFILSKGHAGASVYSALARSGFFDPELLATHCADGSILSGHVSHLVPGVDLSTGSLGHGLGVGCGMAFALKRRGSSPARVFVVLSDGECDEGSNWEAALFAAHHRLDNLVAVIDYNRIQSLASTDSTISLEPFADKWRAFGWHVIEVDGHDHDQLADALQVDGGRRTPTVVIAHTTKGKGVSFMENSVLWHYRSPQDDEFDAAIAELTR